MVENLTEHERLLDLERENSELKRRVAELEVRSRAGAGTVSQSIAVGGGFTADVDLYRQLFDNAKIGLLRTRFEDGKVLACNDRAAQLLGFEDCQAMGDDLCLADHYVDPDDRHHLLGMLKEDGVVRGYEARFRRIDGSEVWLRISVEWMEAEHWIEGIIEDVTDRKRAEIALRDSEERLRAIFETARDYVFVKDHRLRYTHVNPALADLFKTTVPDLIGITDEKLFDAEVAERVRMSDERVLAGEIVDESNISRINGVEHVFHSVKVPLRDVHGDIVGLCGIARDITELKRSEDVERVMASILQAAVSDVDLRTLIAGIRESLRGLINTANFYVALYDPQTECYSFPYYADEYDELERFEPEPLPQSLTDYVRRTGRPLFGNQEVFRELESRGDVGLVGTDSQQWLGVPLITDDGVCGVVVVQSYTDANLYTAKDLDLLSYAGRTIAIAVERKRIEEERRELAARVLRSQKMESLGTFAGGISHEFNNLLQSILGSSSLAEQMLPEGSPIHTQLRMIERAAHHAAELTSQMRAYAGRGRFIAEDLDLSAETEEAAKFLPSQLVREGALRLELDRNLPPISADAAEIRQMVTSILTNAFEASNETGGDVTVTTSLEHRSREQLESSILGEDLQPGSYVVLEVSDSGRGMGPEILAKVFDPFFSTKFTGRGLGMAAVLGIVRANQGAIRVESNPGSGTTVRVYLPTSEAAPGSAVVSPENDTATAGKPTTIMVVDDDDAIRDLCREMLEQAGFHVVTAADGVVAVELLRQSPSTVDAVLLDMTMPRLSGVETFRALVEIRPDLPVIVASGYSEQDAGATFQGSGPSGYLQKPYRLKELVSALERIGVQV